MQTMRIHDASWRSSGRIPFIALKLDDHRRLTIELDDFETEPTQRVPSFCLSSDAVMDVLQGAEVLIERPEGNVRLLAHREVLQISCDSIGARVSKRYQVWLAELGLGFNLLGGKA